MLWLALVGVAGMLGVAGVFWWLCRVEDEIIDEEAGR